MVQKTQTLRCTECKREWTANTTVQYGITNIDDNGYCPSCGADGEVIGEVDYQAEQVEQKFQAWKERLCCPLI